MSREKVLVLNDAALSSITGGSGYYDYEAAGKQAYKIGQYIGTAVSIFWPLPSAAKIWKPLKP